MRGLLLVGLILVGCGDDKETIKAAVAAAEAEQANQPDKNIKNVDACASEDQYEPRQVCDK